METDDETGMPRWTNGHGRRRFLTGAGSAAVLSPVLADVAAASPDIDQPADPGEAGFLARAFEMRDLASAKGDQPYGAVVVRDMRIIGQSWSRVILDTDPTGHAEISAIRDAARRTGRRDLSGAALYASSRPCPMCEAAAYWAGISRMVYGPGGADAGAPRLCR